MLQTKRTKIEDKIENNKQPDSVQDKWRHELGTVLKAGDSNQIRGEEEIKDSFVEFDLKERVGF